MPAQDPPRWLSVWTALNDPQQRGMGESVRLLPFLRRPSILPFKSDVKLHIFHRTPGKKFFCIWWWLFWFPLVICCLQYLFVNGSIQEILSILLRSYNSRVPSLLIVTSFNVQALCPWASVDEAQHFIIHCRSFKFKTPYHSPQSLACWSSYLNSTLNFHICILIISYPAAK